MSARPHLSAALAHDHSSAGRTAVVLLHGLCSTPDELRSVRIALQSSGYTVEPLQIGGYSFDAAALPPQATPYAQWIDAVERRVLDLRAAHDRVMLVGLSAGAALALGVAIRCGEQIDALVLMSTPLRLDGWAVARTQWLLPLALHTPVGRFWRYRERAPYGVKDARVRGWIERELKERRISSAGSAVIGIGHLREHERLLRHVRARLGAVRCRRVLALHAREDEVASVANLDLLARGLRVADYRAVVLGNSYHMITIDNDRQQVVRETMAFAAEVSAAPLQRTAAA